MAAETAGLHDLVSLDDLQSTVPGGISRETLWRWCMRGIGGRTMVHSRGRRGMLLSTRHNVNEFMQWRAKYAQQQYGIDQHLKAMTTPQGRRRMKALRIEAGSASAYLTQHGM